ncbi:DUF305 domain-containing protein [Actinoplanes derwentensis]|uniref:Uncharacterized conserved protein, DUF305 family n=1 Tax=Actinoplanes derwentensis TaxID=113562 RepID=A0A1H2CEW7_9ACTN|nr:DUF305 domain-containing protein [Actinoplanes derwentensis]GID86078.1 lipoprotein [Actinoplanes derwentensis]SDT69095.1 Uncharacterized conserved protein, DUF305 family [Actinoplanes derwentensis]
MQHRRAWALTAATLALGSAVGVAVLARASGRTEPVAAPDPSSSAVRVLIPGRPGESATVTDADNVQAPEQPRYNQADVAYAQMMIVHHAQAIEMADLAPDRAANDGVRNIASRISAAQAPEISTLRTWLADRGQPESNPAHDHATMPGMQPADKMTALKAATGADFDRQFVAMMIEHHFGAQTMVGTVLKQGSDLTLAEWANETAVEQVGEIRRMRDLGVV